jgi:3-phenylpropionate/trans-cinnamate dioxygenase ferredoxin reductase subunit
MNGVLVVGAGLAGSRCAETLRAGGYEGPITLVGDEPHAPYERPALSKEILAGTRSPEDVLLRPPGWWAEQSIELRTGVTVNAIDPRRRTALVAGRELTWDHLVLATGAQPRRLAVVPASAHVLRTMADALALRSLLLPGQRLVVVGAGLIGAEVASGALALGCEVTLVDAASAPMLQAVGPEVGSVLAERWTARGAMLHLDANIADADAHTLELADGTPIPYDVLLVAIGAAPVGMPGNGAGEIVTDAYGRTAQPRVYACGDVAAFGRRRVEHWTAAASQGATVARTILGEQTPYADLPYFWSDQFGLRLQMVGDRAGAVSVQLDGGADSFSARYLDSTGKPVAVLLANRGAEVAAARRELAAAA